MINSLMINVMRCCLAGRMPSRESGSVESQRASKDVVSQIRRMIKDGADVLHC